MDKIETSADLKIVVESIALAGKTLLGAAVDFVYRRVRELAALEAGPREYVYVGGLEADRPGGYLPGDRGAAVWRPATPAGTRIKLVDLIVVVDPGAGFAIDDVAAGGDTLLAARGPIPVEVFAPAVIGRGFESHPVAFDAEHPLVVKFFRRGEALPGDSPRAFWAAAKVRSDLPPSTDLPKGDLT